MQRPGHFVSFNADMLRSHRHKVTGTECYEGADEPCGGILADDMGLGKTLSAISVIASSRDDAELFSVRSTTQTAIENLHLTNTRGTLVVVPSLRKTMHGCNP